MKQKIAFNIRLYLNDFNEKKKKMHWINDKHAQVHTCLNIYIFALLFYLFKSIILHKQYIS